MSELEIFIRQIRSRSAEHQKAVELLSCAELPGQIVAILRQELDSMVRVIYLLSQPVERRNSLISQSVGGEKWRQDNSKGSITDKEMVDLAQKLNGWTLSVYKFGCAFIHLSALHDYESRDPIGLLPPNERNDLIQHCRYYHGGPIQDNPSFKDFVPYLPDVFKKISSNLKCYLADLIAN
ncbi:MAG: hypothetical protein ACSLFB_10340 [Acidimicrobiales bacterium]